MGIPIFLKTPRPSTAMWKRLIWFLAAVTSTAAASGNADTPHFTADEIAIYRDFLLHYPEQPSEMIGMQEYTVRFIETYAFGDEPNPPKLNLETPAYSSRQLPPEVMELTTEDAVTTRAAAERKPIYPQLGSCPIADVHIGRLGAGSIIRAACRRQRRWVLRALAYIPPRRLHPPTAVSSAAGRSANAAQAPACRGRMNSGT